MGSVSLPLPIPSLLAGPIEFYDKLPRWTALIGFVVVMSEVPWSLRFSKVGLACHSAGNRAPVSLLSEFLALPDLPGTDWDKMDVVKVAEPGRDRFDCALSLFGGDPSSR